MTPILRLLTGVVLVVAAAACGGGSGDAGPPPVTVATVAITSPAIAPTFGAFQRTVQFVAEPRMADGTAIAGRTVTWSSSTLSVGTISAGGLFTAVGNGTTQVRATVDGVQSAPVTVTVSQVVAAVSLTPGAFSMGAKGSTRQLAVAVQDSGAAAVTRSVTTTWSGGDPAVATVNGTGLVTAVANGTTKVIATAEGHADTSDVTVAIVVNTVTVTGSLLPDTLHTTGSTKQFAAAATDSNGNAVAGASFTWLSGTPAVASVDGSGLVTAVGDGSASIQATSGGRTGSRTMVVRRYAATFTMSPTAPQSITTAGGTLAFSGTVQDSVGTNLPIGWASLSTVVATVAPATGTSTTVTAVGSGTTQIVMSGGTRSASTQVTVSIPVSFAASVQPIFTQNCAVSGCHVTPGPAGNLNLASGSSYAQLVNVAADGLVGAIRVIPNNASSSYLVRKLEGGPNITGSRMPQGASPLPQATVNIIRAWIDQGALNN